MLKKIITLTVLAALMLPMASAFAHPHHSRHYPRHHRRYDYDSHRYHKDRVIGAVILGGILGAVITAQAKDKENDGVNDRSRCDSCGKR